MIFDINCDFLKNCIKLYLIVLKQIYFYNVSKMFCSVFFIFFLNLKEEYSKTTINILFPK